MGIVLAWGGRLERFDVLVRELQAPLFEAVLPPEAEILVWSALGAVRASWRLKKEL